MKIAKYITPLMAAIALAAGVTSCDNDFDYPPVILPDGIGTGDGSASSPLSVKEVSAYYSTYYSDIADDSQFYWATGYIVGCVATTETVFVATDATSQFSAPFGIATNILLAATPDETDFNNCISVQLPSGAVRTALNLADNPSNLSKLVTIHGYITKYVGLPGLKSVDAFNWGDQGIAGMDPVVYTEASAITSGKAYALVAQNGTSYLMGKPADASAAYGWLYSNSVSCVDHTIKADESCSFLFTESATPGQYYIVDFHGRYLYMSGTYNSFQLSPTLIDGDNSFRWMPIANADGTFTITNCGTSKVIQYYVEKSSFGAYSTIEAGYLLPHLYEYTGETTITPGGSGEGEQPSEPSAPVEGAIYSALGEADTDITAGWTFDNINLSGDLSYVWAWKEYSGSHYLNGSAYLGGALAAEAYAISGEISLEGATGCTVSFDHAAKFQTTLKSGCTICVREAGSSQWTDLTIPNWPAAGSWAFANSGDISLAAYDGKKIQLAFKYVSTTAGADTWEIKNLTVKGSK